jgi:signal transduction histidine kinase
MLVPTRLHFDAHQLIREAVANAVRHAGAKNVSIRVGGEKDEVTLDVINDGASYPRGARRNPMPGSLQERVEAAGGRLDLSRGMGVTKVSIALPIAGKVP